MGFAMKPCIDIWRPAVFNWIAWHLDGGFLSLQNTLSEIIVTSAAESTTFYCIHPHILVLWMRIWIAKGKQWKAVFGLPWFVLYPFLFFTFLELPGCEVESRSPGLTFLSLKTPLCGGSLRLNVWDHYKQNTLKKVFVWMGAYGVNYSVFGKAYC